MKKAATTVGIILTLSINMYAKITDEKDYYTTLCIEDNSIGFNWEKGQWKSTNFKTKKYIIQKLKIEKSFSSKSGECIFWQDHYADPYGCYNIRKFGNEFYNFESQVCLEIWKKDSNGKKYLESVNCNLTYPNIKFSPNGWFHLGYIHEQTENNPKKDYKDSLSISVGKCSIL